MTPKQRLDAVLANQKPDRTPFSFWYHFPPDQVAGPVAVRAHLDQLHTYQLDFLKVMNDNPYPHPRIQKIEDLASLAPLKGDEESFTRQLDLIRALHAAAGSQVYMATTIFNAWATLRGLVSPPREHKPPNLDANADIANHWLRDAHKKRPDLVAKALATIAENLARFAANCLEAGADGIFLSVRDDWLAGGDTPGSASLYDTLVRPTDKTILNAVRNARFNILHVCGKAVNFRAFADYPVPIINWADRAAGPAIRDVATWAKPALAAGIDNLGTLPTGTPEQVKSQAKDAIAQAAGRPIILAPGCTFDPKRVPPANLRALADAAKES